LRAAAAAFATLIATSCYYDPYSYGGDSFGGGGYGGGSLGTTFVYTGSDRWLYDPAVFCYYDRYRRCYYDPYLYGYYPVGYCPRPIYGAYHPHGWRPGNNYCPPPSGYRDRFLPNYQNRIDQLKASNYAWAEKVRERNDATSEAWRNQRFRAASNYQAARVAQQDRNQQLRDSQAQRQQNLRGQQQDWADKVRSQRGVPAAAQRQPKPAAYPPAGMATSPRAQGRSAAPRPSQGAVARQQVPSPRVQPPAAPSQAKDGGGGGGAWKEKMQERKAARNQ
jgi:hypothetical protein